MTFDMETSTLEYWTKLIQANLAKTALTSDSACDLDIEDAVAIDEELLNAPRRRSARHELAYQVAAQIYPNAEPESLGPIIKYEKDISMLKGMVQEQRRQAVATATARNANLDWVKRISKRGPWDPVEDPLSLAGPPSLPMPVEVSDKESLAPFFAHLRNGGTHEPAATSNPNTSTTGVEPYHGVELIEFEKGVLYSDGRVDLCKMVTGPRNIQDLMDSLSTNPFSKHFLLGNNVIGPTGAHAIADFITKYPDKFETWYLAGNCIDGDGFSVLVDSMVTSTVITNVWMKRNPLGPEAAHDVFRLITGTPELRTLDLDQTNLGDAGVAKLFNLLASHDKQIPLRHIYLNGTGIGTEASMAIALYLASPHCSLTSLYLSNNPVGDAGAAALATGLENNATIERLSLLSCGLTNASRLLSSLVSHPSIKTLDLGQSYATEDLGMRYNWLTVETLTALVTLVNTNKHLRYLNLSYTPMSQAELNQVDAAVSTSGLVWYHAKSMTTGERDVASVKAGQEHVRLHKLVRERLHANVMEEYGVDYITFEAEHKRYLVSPKDVRLIDSVYRNRDAGAARRGLKKLDKWWSEGDDTLEQVQNGTFV